MPGLHVCALCMCMITCMCVCVCVHVCVYVCVFVCVCECVCVHSHLYKWFVSILVFVYVRIWNVLMLCYVMCSLEHHLAYTPHVCFCFAGAQEYIEGWQDFPHLRH